MNTLELIVTHSLLVRPSFTGNWRAGRFLGVTGHAMPRAYCEDGTEWEAETIEEAVALCVSAISEGRRNPKFFEFKAACEQKVDYDELRVALTDLLDQIESCDGTAQLNIDRAVEALKHGHNKA